VHASKMRDEPRKVDEVPPRECAKHQLALFVPPCCVYTTRARFVGCWVGMS
jgi:hypothetical protein